MTHIEQLQQRLSDMVGRANSLATVATKHEEAVEATHDPAVDDADRLVTQLQKDAATCSEHAVQKELAASKLVKQAEGCIRKARQLTAAAKDERTYAASYKARAGALYTESHAVGGAHHMQANRQQADKRAAKRARKLAREAQTKADKLAARIERKLAGSRQPKGTGDVELGKAKNGGDLPKIVKGQGLL